MDKYNIINKNGKKEITLQKICDVIGIDVPDKFVAVKDIVNNNVVSRLEFATKGSCVFRIINIGSKGPKKEWFKQAEEKGVIAIFMEREQYINNGFDKTDYPIIPIDNVLEKCGEFYSYIKDLNSVKTIAVTGTCGKTTTMKFLESIVPNNFKTYMNKGNANSFFTIAKHIMHELTDDKDVYIQEVGAGSPDSIRKSASMLTPDAFVLLNVFRHHINTYKTQENIFNDKSSFDEYLKPGGVAIVNYDDELIRHHEFKNKVISFGIETDVDVDYRAENIRQNESSLELDIVYDNKTVHIDVNILGIQNAYNVLAAFAVCKWLGLSDEKILSGFSSYESTGYRQNYRRVGANNLLIDCYNVCENSLRAAFNTMNKLDSPVDGKKIAVITGENKLADDAERLSFALGKDIDGGNIDKIICVGVAEETPYNLNYYCHSRALYEGIRATGHKDVSYVTNLDDLEKELESNVKDNDIILFKGMYNMDLTTVIDKVFGTAISMNNPYYIKNAKKVKNDTFEAIQIKNIEGLDIVKAHRVGKSVCIPSSIDDIPIFRLSPKLFMACRKIKEVDLGGTLRNIGNYAFAGCIGLKKVKIPSSVKVIERGAFYGCIGLRKVEIEEGVTHIDKDAFKNCLLLREVKIPKSVKHIDKTAFDNCFFLKNRTAL